MCPTRSGGYLRICNKHLLLKLLVRSLPSTPPAENYVNIMKAINQSFCWPKKAREILFTELRQEMSEAETKTEVNIVHLYLVDALDDPRD